MNNDKRLFALLSLGLLLAALLVPILIAAYGRQEYALPFGLVAGLLALLFAVLGWGDRIGKIVAITLLLFLVAGGGSSVVIYMVRSQDTMTADQR